MWDKLDRWFDRHKYGVIGTLLLHSVAMFALSVAQMRGRIAQTERAEQFMEVLPPMTEQQLEAFMATDQTPVPAGGEVINATSNVSAEIAKPSAATLERYAAKSMEELKAMEQQEFERLAQERAERGEEIVVPELTPEKWDKKLYMEPAKPVKVAGNVTVAFDLIGEPERGANIKVPAYQCKTGGVVLVDIEVDRDGQVRRAQINTGGSTTTEPCMLELAGSAALSAAFSPAANAPSGQKGWIRFTFVAQ